MSKNQQTGSKATPSQAQPSRNNLPHNSAAKPFPKTFNESAFVTQQHQAANKTASPRVCATKTTFATVLMFAMGSAAQGQTAQPQGEALAPVQTHWRATAETLTLPGGEKMGLLGGNVLFDVAEHLRLGVASYGALSGQRGGFITLGVAGEAHRRLSDAWGARAGLFVGAGGGRGGNTLAGGGLMLRGDVGLTYGLGGFGALGFGVSHVRFPSGVINSTQPYLQYDYSFYSLLGPGWQGAAAPREQAGGSARRAAVPAHRSEFSLAARSLRIPASALRVDGLPQHPSMQLLGVEWLAQLDERWFLKLESEGAMGGQSNGYMQILAGGGYRWPLSASTAIKLQAAGGPAGGGGVDTGGGLLLDAGVALQHAFTPHLALEAGVGAMRAPSGNFQAQYVGVKLNYLFDLPSVTSRPVAPSELASLDAARLRVRLATQTYFQAAPQWRTFSVDQPVSNLGVQLDYFPSPSWYLTGQGLAAFAGDAGAYMTGQVGAGLHRPLGERWFVEAEALLGAAGGGGLAVGGGLVGQGNVALGYKLSKSMSVMGTLGRIQSFGGGFKANVAGLSLAYQFTGFTAP